MMSNMNADEAPQQVTRSRNITNVVTTNGITTSNHNQGSGSQGAILNINTASDINIYNNSFIVQTSPGQSQPQLPGPISTTTPGIAHAKNSSTNRNGNNKRQTQKSLNNGNNSQSSTHRVGTNPKANGRGSGSVNNNQALLNNTTSAQNQIGFGGGNGNLRSMSTGRNQKSATGSRAAMANTGSGKRTNEVTQGGSSKTSRTNAINEAYNQNRSYVINNQILPGQQQSMSSTQ